MDPQSYRHHSQWKGWLTRQRCYSFRQPTQIPTNFWNSKSSQTVFFRRLVSTLPQIIQKPQIIVLAHTTPTPTHSLVHALQWPSPIIHYKTQQIPFWPQSTSSTPLPNWTHWFTLLPSAPPIPYYIHLKSSLFRMSVSLPTQTTTLLQSNYLPTHHPLHSLRHHLYPK